MKTERIEVFQRGAHRIERRVECDSAGDNVVGGSLGFYWVGAVQVQAGGRVVQTMQCVQIKEASGLDDAFDRCEHCVRQHCEQMADEMARPKIAVPQYNGKPRIANAGG